MENFKDKIKIQNISFTVCSVILALFLVFLFIGKTGLIPNLVPTPIDDRWTSVWSGFATGASSTMLGFMIFGLIRNKKALKDEKALKKLYVKENDERTIQVGTSARAAAFQTFLLLGIVAAIIAGYFNMTVCVTIIATLFCASMVVVGFSFYYENKF